MYEYKAGDIVKIINGKGSDLGSMLNCKEVILDTQPDDGYRLGTDSKYNQKLVFSYFDRDGDLVDSLYFRDEDIELVGWTYIPDYELIKDKRFKLIETDLNEQFVNPNYINSEEVYKHGLIELDSRGYFCSFGGSMIDLQIRVSSNSDSPNYNIFNELQYKVEIRLDNTIKIFYKEPQVIFDISIIEEYKTIFNDYFKEDCEIRKINNIEYEFVIHFPDIIIKNELDKTHPIKDLYVFFNLKVLQNNRFVFMRENQSDYYLSGCRGTVTDREYAVKYQHSHLSSGYHNSKFCLGTGPILTNIAAFNMRNDSLLFEKIMLDIIDYISVESIEGTPYIEFKCVYTPRNQQRINISDLQLRQEYLNFLSYYDNLPVSISNLEIKVDENNPEFIKQVSAITNFINGQESEIQISNSDKNKLMLIFKNEEVRLKIIKEEKTDEQNKEQLQRVANTRVLQYIAKKLSEDLSDKAISGITRKSEAGYFTGTLVEDTSTSLECRENRVVRSIVSKSGRKLTKL